MPLFPVEVCSGIADRLAAIAQTIDQTCIADRLALPPGNMFRRATVTDDYDVENGFITPTYNTEQDLSGVTLLASDQNIQSLVNAFDTHTLKVAAVTLNTYLTSSGLQLHEKFADLYTKVRGSALLSRNTFTDSPVVMGSFFKNGVSNYTFIPGKALGTGGTTSYSPVNSSTPNTGASQIFAALPSGTALSVGSLNFSVSGLNDYGATQYGSVTMSTTGISGLQVLVSGVRMNTVTSINLSSDSTTFSAGQSISIYNKLERTITL